MGTGTAGLLLAARRAVAAGRPAVRSRSEAPIIGYGTAIAEWEATAMTDRAHPPNRRRRHRGPARWRVLPADTLTGRRAVRRVLPCRVRLAAARRPARAQLQRRHRPCHRALAHRFARCREGRRLLPISTSPTSATRCVWQPNAVPRSTRRLTRKETSGGNHPRSGWQCHRHLAGRAALTAYHTWNVCGTAQTCCARTRSPVRRSQIPNRLR